MAELKTRKTKLSVQDFLNAIPDAARRQECFTVLELMRRASGAEPEMWGASIVGFGSYHYRYASGREGDWMAVGFSPRKQNLTLYIVDGFEGHAPLMKKLGKYKTGKSCLYIHKLSDVDLPTLEQLVRASVAHVTGSHPA